MSEVTRVFAETYKMYDENLDAFSNRWKDVVVLGARPEDCRLRSVEAFGHTWRVSLAGEQVEVPPEGFPATVGPPDEDGLQSLRFHTPWTGVTLAVVASPLVPQTLVNWFAECSHLREVHGLELLGTSRARSLQGMFLGCESLEALDVSGFDTSQAEDLSSMFFGCSALRTLDLSGFDTSRVTNMSSMLSGCSSLRSVNVTGLDTSRVTHMSNLFCSCSALRELDLSGFDTSHAEHLSGLFWNCTALEALDLSGFDFSNATTMLFMFRNCSSLAALRMPGVSPERADKIRMGAMFEGTDSLGDTPQHLVELVRSGTGVSIGNL